MDNKAALDFMMSRVDDFPQWVVTIAFYKAMHIVEAMFAADPQAQLHDTSNHEDRNRQLKTTDRYQHIWKHYRALWNDSLIARYLSEESFDSTKPPFQFSMYLPPAKVVSPTREANGFSNCSKQIPSSLNTLVIPAQAGTAGTQHAHFAFSNLQ